MPNQITKSGTKAIAGADIPKVRKGIAMVSMNRFSPITNPTGTPTEIDINRPQSAS
jgi:hypothetical protein